MELNELLGTILVGTWVNVMLYMLEVIQVYKYFTHYASDKVVFKVAVIAVFVVDTVCTIAECAAFYLYSVVHWGEPSFLHEMPWPIPVYLISTGITAAIVQVFMLHRHWVLTRRSRMMVTFVIGVFIVVSLAGSLMTTTLTAMFSSNSQRYRNVVAVYLWFVSSAIADLVIAIAMLIQVVSADYSVISKRQGRRLAILALKTGTVTAVFAVATLIVYASKPQSNRSFATCFPIGRLYALTLLYNLNIRLKIRRESTTLNVESFSMSDRSTRTGELSRPERTKISTLTSVSSQMYPGSSINSELVDEFGIRKPESAIIVDEALHDVPSQKYASQTTLPSNSV